jgi:hypothetical protein
MQGLSPENLEGSQPFPTSTPEGSPRQSEVTVVTTPQVERTDSLENFQITNTQEDFRIHRDSERPFIRLNYSRDLVVTSSRSPVGPFPSIEGQDLFLSTIVFRRDLFGPGSPMISEINPPEISEISSPETVLLTIAYHFIVPVEMAHLIDTTSVSTGFTVVSLAPINTPRTPNVTLTLPPGYRALNSSILLLRKLHPALLVVLLLLGILFPVLFQHSLNFLLEDLLRILLVVLILVALFHHSLQITSFRLVDNFTKVV